MVQNGSNRKSGRGRPRKVDESQPACRGSRPAEADVEKKKALIRAGVLREWQCQSPSVPAKLRGRATASFRQRQSARRQGGVGPPSVGGPTVGGSNGHNDTSDRSHHRADCFRWRLVRSGTLVLSGPRPATGRVTRHVIGTAHMAGHGVVESPWALEAVNRFAPRMPLLNAISTEHSRYLS